MYSQNRQKHREDTNNTSGYIYIYLLLSRPSEIQEVLSQVKVRGMLFFFALVWRDRSILYTDICGHGYYEYVEYKQMHLKLHLC